MKEPKKHKIDVVEVLPDGKVRKVTQLELFDVTGFNTSHLIEEYEKREAKRKLDFFRSKGW